MRDQIINIGEITNTRTYFQILVEMDDDEEYDWLIFEFYKDNQTIKTIHWLTNKVRSEVNAICYTLVDQPLCIPRMPCTQSFFDRENIKEIIEFVKAN